MAPTLPVETWGIIIEYLDFLAKKQLRLVNIELNRLVAPCLFKILSFNLDAGGVDRLSAIANSERLRANVHELVLRRNYGLRNFVVGFDEWESAVLWEFPRFRELEDGHRDTADVGPDVFMSAQEWANLPTEERLRLFEQYEHDRTALAEHRFHLIRTACYRPLGFLEHREPLYASTTDEQLDQSPSNLLDVAVSRLTQLRAFRHEPAYLMDRTWGTRWGRIRFDRIDILRTTSLKEDEEMENLQLSLSLRALGIAGNRNECLHNLDLYAAGAAFWGATNLRRLWDPEFSIFERYDILWSDEEQTEDWIHRIGGAREALSHQERLTRELVTMESAFIHLERLELEIECGPEHPDASNAAHQLFCFLRRAKALVDLSLTFHRDPTFADTPHRTFPYCGGETGEAASSLLHWLGRSRCFPVLQRLYLSLPSRGDDFLLFLSALPPSLRHLNFESIALIPGSGRWEPIIEHLAKYLPLRDVHLRCLEDDGIPNGRLILEPSDVYWRKAGEDPVCYGHYRDAIYAYILGRSTVKPVLDLDQFMRYHVYDCTGA